VKLRKEIEAVVGVGPEARHPDRTDLKKMIYLTYVVKEGWPSYQKPMVGTLADSWWNTVLRLYPSVPVNSRAAVERTTLPTGGGPDGTAPVMVRKGESVAYSVYVMHRRKDLYGSDADLFRPERWDPNEENEVSLKNVGWGYLPFNGGPRVCLGRKSSSSLVSIATDIYDRRIRDSGGFLHHRQIAADIQGFRI
jgi:cytochrome P450